MTMPLIELKKVDKFFKLESGREMKVLENINISVNEGEVLALLGPSGSGKSTCLRLMCGLLQPTEGSVMLRGEHIQGVNQEASLVFQSFALFPWETVFKNIEIALSSMGFEEREAKKRVKKAIDLVGLEGFEEAYPREMSGGMKQRVGVARALAMERPVLFLDEPFSALDVLTADTLRDEILKIFHEKSTRIQSMVIVTHNIQEAIVMADRILILGSNPGHVRAELKNNVPFPREPNTLAFRQMASQIHRLITEAYIPDNPKTVSRTQKGERIEVLPEVQILDVIGLLEVVSEEGGSQDLFELGTQIGKDFGQTLYLVKSAELLQLVDTPKQQVVLTAWGDSFVSADVNQRKRMINQSFAQLLIVKKMTELLRESQSVRLPVEVVTEKMHELLPNENAEKMVETLISWGRFAEYFGYNDDTGEIYLDVGQETQ